MKRYENVLRELQTLFPHSTQIRIEVDTNKVDIDKFNYEVNTFIKDEKMYVIGNQQIENNKFLEIRTSSGSIKLINNE